jgi:hypothetical protein
MSDRHVVFVSKSFLRSHLDSGYRAWHDSENEKALDDRLALRAKRRESKETSAESAFIDARHGVCPDQPAGFRDWVLSISEVRYPLLTCKRRQWRNRSCYRLLQQDSTEPDSASALRG